jgi:hypothetical protein
MTEPTRAPFPGSSTYNNDNVVQQMSDADIIGALKFYRGLGSDITTPFVDALQRGADRRNITI